MPALFTITHLLLSYKNTSLSTQQYLFKNIIFIYMVHFARMSTIAETQFWEVYIL